MKIFSVLLLVVIVSPIDSYNYILGLSLPKRKGSLKYVQVSDKESVRYHTSVKEPSKATSTHIPTNNIHYVF